MSADTEGDSVLRHGFQVNPLSPDAMSRIRAAVEVEWRAHVVDRKPRRWLAYAAAASLLVMLVSLKWFYAAPGHESFGALTARLVRFESPGVTDVQTLGRSAVLGEGALLRAGNTYRANGQALLELADGGNLRVASGTEFEIVAKDVVRLERGEMYVDIPPGTHTKSAFIARTPAGEFRHVGTQFALAIIAGETRLRVREGTVRWLADQGEATVNAGTEVVFANGSKTVERPIGTSGKEWDWIAATTPDFEIDNRPLAEFLEWVARESGRKLVLADEQSRKRVMTIRMHGSVRGLTPMQALAAVMSATELRYDLPDGEIRVSFAGATALQN